MNKVPTQSVRPAPIARASHASAAPGYAKPRLIVYGTLIAITAKVGSKGKWDRSGSRRTGF